MKRPTPMRAMLPVVWLMLILYPGAHGHAMELPTTAAVPGGVVVLDLDDSDHAAPRARYNGSRVMTVSRNGRWYAVVGIPLQTQPGPQRLELSRNGYSVGFIPFRVRTKQYKAQYITLKNKRMVEPNAEDLQRIRDDQRRIQAALHHWSPTQPTTLRFALPARGRFSSGFGLRRFFNKKPRRPHSGLDIAAPRGTPVTAPAPGHIIETGNYYFNGNTVFIDHGQGLITMYCHLDRIDVTTGQQVQTSQLIGTIGSTGRVTGAHLHWSVSLNATMVEPRLFIDKP